MTSYTELPGAEIALRFLIAKAKWPGDIDMELNGPRYSEHRYNHDTHQFDKVDGYFITYINCSDTFFWGTSDCEELTEENIHIFEETVEELTAYYKKYDNERGSLVRSPALADARQKWLEDNPGIDPNMWNQSKEFKEAKKPQDVAYRLREGVEAALEDLFCARVRGERPQGACYSRYPQELWPLFDAVGPERETGLGNPFKPGEYK